LYRIKRDLIDDQGRLTESNFLTILPSSDPLQIIPHTWLWKPLWIPFSLLGDKQSRTCRVSVDLKCPEGIAKSPVGVWIWQSRWGKKWNY